MVDRLTILGTGTCQLQPHRATSSCLIERGDTKIVFDMGRGVTTRLASSGLRQNDIQHLILSHFHPDHVSDLIPYLHAACWSRIDARSTDLHIYGPKGVEVQVQRILSLFGPDELVRSTFRVVIHEERGASLSIDSQLFEFVDLPPAGNHGVKWRVGDKQIALTGDSYFHDAEIAFLRGVDLAVFDSGHLTQEEILDLSVATQVRRLVCSHLYQELDSVELNRVARERGFTGEFIVATDGMSFDLTAL